MLSALLFLTYGGLTLSLEDLGIYQPGLHVCALSNGHYLWAGPADNVLVVTDAEGHILHRYDKAGSGPKSLNRPMLLGYDLENIFIINDKLIQVYNHKLELQNISLPPINEGNTGGLYLTRNRFALERSRYPVDGIRVVRLEGDQWVKERSVLPLPPDFLDNRRKYVSRNTVEMANGLVFHHKDMNLYDEQQRYQIDVYQLSEDGQEKELLELSASLDSIPESGAYRPNVSAAARVEDGFICDVIFFERERVKWFSGYLDIFDKDGNLKRRQKMKNWQLVIKVHGKNQMVLLSYEGLEVHVISSIHDIPRDLTIE